MNPFEVFHLSEEAVELAPALLEEVAQIAERKAPLGQLLTAGKDRLLSGSLVHAFDIPGERTEQELGRKGFWLAKLTKLGAPVPPGFTISTRAATAAGDISPRLWTQVQGGMQTLEGKTGLYFGDADRPLIVSVRSGAATSMPGMMDTILNVGLNDKIVGSIARTENEQFAWCTYSRFLRNYGETVRGVPREAFQSAESAGSLSSKTPYALAKQSDRYRKIIEDASGKVPDEPGQQLHESISAVFKSWNNPRATTYRRLYGIPDEPGTAVSVQKMVFGNKLRSGTGIALSHNALTGTRRLSGEWLSEAQDELVSGERTPLPLSQLKELHPDAYKQLNTFVSRTHKMVGEPLEFEFTVESDKLHLLQARAQKLAPESAIKRVVQDVKAGKITQADALAKITPTQVEAVRLARFRPSALRDAEPLASGLPASPGAAVGRVVHSSQEALTATRRGESVILVRPTTDPSDLDGMLAAKALITKNGGTTSHAAIVALEQGKPCITGCEGLANLKGIVSVDGFTGKAYTGALPLEKLQHNPEVETFLRWVNEEEAKKWPAPRLIESTGRHEELAPEAANFYLSERMAHALKTTPLGAEADKLKVDMNVAMAEKMAGMMVDGIETELRAFNVTNLRYTPQLQSDFDTLTNEFGVSLNWSTQEHKNVMEGLIKSSVEDQRRFLGAAENLFSRAEWGNGYEYIDDRYHVFGGSSWGRIASAAQRFLSGDLSHSLFVDHAMDLYHNKGNFFESVIRVLNAQRDALTLDGLYGELSHLDIDPKVRSLYERGSQLKVW